MITILKYKKMLKILWKRNKMIIVGENLRTLISGSNICRIDNFDGNSINIKLDCNIFRPNEDSEKTIKYGLHEKIENFYTEEQLIEGELILKPGQCALACSNEKLSIPLGYMGWVQTKGTLARMFVSSHCTDSQIEPGFQGKITLEIVNHSPFNISIPVGSIVAQLFILRCSTNNSLPYKGKYQNSDKPTLPLPIK